MEFEQDKSIYAQIAEKIMENILDGVWEEECRIPSVRELAVSMEVNPNTVARAYNFLHDRKVIFNRRGIGYFVGEEGRKKAADIKKQDFFEKELPRFFRTLTILDIGMGEIEERYNEFIYNELNEKEENNENEQ